MTKEDKELVLIDLSARLPYGVIVGYSTKDNPNTLDKIGRVIYVDIRFGMIQMQVESGISYGLSPSEFIKPYLRPMSSMAEEERKELGGVAGGVFEISKGGVEVWSKSFEVNGGTIVNPFARPHTERCLISSTSCFKLLDWLNAHHFDYRGLIEKGLALEAPEGMY